MRRERIHYIFTKVAHFVAGFLTGYSTELSFVLPILMFLVFIVYELDEDWHISDNAYEDIRDYAVGLYLYASYKLLSFLLTHIFLN